jgi:8-amino-3,8-dideoxy-alpha-D-manno-octulosonate transaminase
VPGWEFFDENEKKQIDEVMETGIIMRFGFEGQRKARWKAREMEAEIRKKTGAAHALLLADGTAAITTALAALGVGAGDEVIMPPFTFVATFESIMAAGATPVVAEADDTLCLSPESVLEYITPRTKAVMPVHMCGAAGRLDELRSICRDRNLLLVEDACQAFGASYHGVPVGTIGDAGCYSFDFNKMVTCGEGGAIVTNSREIYERADMYHDHGHDHAQNDRGAEGHVFPGYNYRITELHAALGLAQIAKMDRFMSIQRENKRILKEKLSEVKDIRFRTLTDPEGDCATFLSFFTPTEDKARKTAAALKEAGVGGVFHWYDNNWHYIRNWSLFIERNFAHKIGSDILNGMADYTKRTFKSDDLISRCVSITISLKWSPDDALSCAEKAAAAIGKVL